MQNVETYGPRSYRRTIFKTIISRYYNKLGNKRISREAMLIRMITREEVSRLEKEKKNGKSNGSYDRDLSVCRTNAKNDTIMAIVVSAVLISIILVYLYYFVTGKPSKNFPPGPVRIPVWGSYLHVLWEDFKYPFKAFENMKYKYNAPLIGCYLGDAPTIVANDYATCKAILSKPEFQGRPQAFPVQFRMFGKQLGLFAGEGESWLHAKRFSLRHLRDLGFGRRSEVYEGILEEETKDLVTALQGEWEKGKRSVLVPDIFYPPLFNCIFYLMIGNRYPAEEHEKLRRIGRNGLKFITSNNVTGCAVSIVPWIRHLFPKLTGFEDLSESSSVFEKLMREQFEEHETTFEESALRDMVDTYLKHKGKYPDFTDEQLLITSIDFIFPNTAIAVALSFAIVYLILNPKVQEKCQREIDEVVGRGRLPTLDDRVKMPYVEATLREVMRRQTVNPLSLGRKSTEDTKFFGYDIPKDTFVILNLWCMHMDRDVWGDPENFRPERFLDEKGRLASKDMSFPFGVGKRVCAGETFARQNMFVIFAAVLQHFTFSEDTKIDFSKARFGVALAPQPDLYVKFHPRN